MMLNPIKKTAVTELNAFVATAKKSENILVKKRDFYSLTYRYYGKISVETQEKSLVSEAGSITFIPKGLSYRTEIIEDMHMAVIHFKLQEDIDFRNPAVIMPNHVGIRPLFEEIVQSFRVDSPVNFQSMSAFYHLLSLLESISYDQNTRQIPKKICLAKQYMDESYSNPCLSVESIAQRCHISSSYLRREFQLAYGQTPIRYLKSIRIAQATYMLESGYLSIAEIAKQSGFSSPSYFIQVFHKAMGEAPDRYRQKRFDR